MGFVSFMKSVFPTVSSPRGGAVDHLKHHQSIDITHDYEVRYWDKGVGSRTGLPICYRSPLSY